ncbi:C-C motif chemokine 21-like [Amphiprion ocellaris]|uniref:Chemokine interleukin-8-like domain-containing protein n=1 Tax=Amphiprion ocellaris TaxID=80972 RepID=A0AAQ6AF82_AMPOC|nr:C-C motif chemokine 21-like [Amphiprion ocellaris]
MASKVAALLLLGIICFGFAAADVPADCCLKTSDKHFPAKLISSYKLQDAGKGCDIKATVVITKAGRQLCLVHSDGNPWVQRVLHAVDKRT